MDNSLLAIFNKIWSKSLYYSTWSLARFLSKFKKNINHKNSIFDQNRFKHSTQY